MPKPILIIKNISREGPGLFETVLKEKDIAYQVIDFTNGGGLPHLDNYSALIVLGGPESANDETEKMKIELATIRAALRRNLLYLGICLGMQALVRAAGGEVVRAHVPEVGWYNRKGKNFTVELTDRGGVDPLFDGLPRSFKIFQLHGETVVPSESVVVLGTGKQIKNQIIKVGTNAYGFQPHFELTPEMLETWINEDSYLKQLNRADLLEGFAEIKDEYTTTGKKLFENFIKFLS
ncbi:type 1 glutamine amidotransferase [Candidatus Wolfebacteria bacterium]|nr:type 1 glutamine amidotransferase [Candidatus Wolfebacteria bacterium]